MGIKRKIDDKAMDLSDELRNHAQSKYLTWLCNEEECDMYEAVAIVSGKTEPLEPEYMLGYKLADPVLQIALWGQLRQDRRRQAAENFKATLTPEELKIFEDEDLQESYAKQFKGALKREKKKKKAV